MMINLRMLKNLMGAMEDFLSAFPKEIQDAVRDQIKSAARYQFIRDKSVWKLLPTDSWDQLGNLDGLEFDTYLDFLMELHQRKTLKRKPK